MKKIFILGILLLFTASGCGKFDINSAKDEFKDKVTSSKGYELIGSMEIYNNEDTFKYNLIVNYEKDDKYRVSMINQNNNHEQIILKNEDEVYVVTPSLNKSFKFESEWPDNSSQSYILSSLINDVMNDTSATLTEEDNKYVIKAKVNYPHNKSLKNQKLYFDKKMNLEMVKVYDENNTEKIRVIIDSIDYKARYDDDYFELESLIDSKINNNEEKDNEEETTKIEEVIYPLYVPQNTYLQSEDKVTNNDNTRTILTFQGDKSFILVQEEAIVSEEFEIIPVSGDPLLLTNSVAALSDNALSWTDNNIEYYLTSNNLTTDELATIAQSMGSTALSK